MFFFCFYLGLRPFGSVDLVGSGAGGLGLGAGGMGLGAGGMGLAVGPTQTCHVNVKIMLKLQEKKVVIKNQTLNLET